MARRTTPSSRLNAANLASLGAERLAELLLAASVGDGNLKRRLQLELAAEAGPESLASVVEKRLASLAASRARVSWRKRPDLLRDLETHRQMIVTRLAPVDPAGGLTALQAWFGLFRGLAARVKDPRGELTAAFSAAAPSLWGVAQAALEAEPGAVQSLAEAIGRSPLDYARWIEAGAEGLSPDFARRLLEAMDPSVKSTRLARPAVRRLADRADDLDLWLSLVPDEERRSPDLAADIARRLLVRGRTAEARAALEAALRPSALNRRWTFGQGRPSLTAAWERASIDVMEAEGRADEAQVLRWVLFERDLSAPVLRDYLARLADFDDVEALERAFAHAAAFPDFGAALGFLMDWPAHREAAALIAARPREAGRPHPRRAEWRAQLLQRYPAAADTLGPADRSATP